MQPATVLFSRSKATNMRGLAQRLPDLIDAAGLDFIEPDSLVAVKCHMGEGGCTKFISPIYVRAVVEKILARGALPFLTDTCTLYHSGRRDAVRYLNQAVKHGFTYATVLAPIIIADGLKSENIIAVSLNGKGKHFQTVDVAAATYHADALVVVSHVKGHLVAGFGAALKNLSMGLSSRAFKQRMHASVTPQFKDIDLCTGCGICAEVCPEGAATVTDKASFNLELCCGCAECITHCSSGALSILWNGSPDAVQEKMAEVAAAAMLNKRDKALFINFAIDVTPDCDCFPISDLPVVQDVGAFASRDPVAIDQASVDAINNMPGIPGSLLKTGFLPGEDKFKGIRDAVDWSHQLSHAETMGLGTRKYVLREIP